tara:strand:+ start:2574 stop:2789 length:216 start_codon:yes stop_codon:yes gene_type:complete
MMLFRLILFLAGCTALLALMFKTAADARTSDYKMCQEVAAQVQHSVKLGHISQQEADEIVQRCFDLIGGSK